MDDEIATLLNMNIRLFPSKLEAILRLFTDSILQGVETVLVLNVHTEKDNETRPCGKSKYKNITAGCIERQTPQRRQQDEFDASKTLKLLMKACQHYKKEKGEQAEVMNFARSYSLSPIATGASSAISKANEKIKKIYFRASSKLIRLKICNKKGT